MGNLTHTVSGDIASFRSAARVPIESLKCHFKPKQDLHGYNKPWPGGCGKNLYNKQEKNIITQMAKNDNGQDASAINNNYDANYTQVFPEITYTISGMKGDGTNQGFQRIYFYTQDKQWISRSDYFLNSSFSFTTPTNCYYLQIQGGINEIYDDIQLEKGSTVTSYEPYENICPIEGWNTVEISHTEKNLFGGEVLKNKIASLMPNISINSNNGIISYNNANATQHAGEILYNNFKPNTRYTFIVTYSKDTNRYIHFRFDYSDGTYSMMARSSTITPTDKTTEVFTSTANKTVVSISRQGDEYSTVNLYYNESGLFEGVLTANEFKSYQGQIIPITFPNNQTLYGGYIDLITGDLVNTHREVIFYDGNTTAAGISTISTLGDYTRFWYGRGSNSSTYWRRKPDTVPICNMLPSNTQQGYSYYSDESLHIGASNDYLVSIWCIMPTSLVGTTADSIIEYLNSNNFTYIYELETPDITHLTSTQLKSFLNYNNIWSNTNDITEVSYQIHDSNMIKEAKIAMMASNNKHYKKVIWNNFQEPFSTTYYQPYMTSRTSLEDYDTNIVKSTYLVTNDNGYRVSTRMKTNEPQIYTNHKYYLSYMIYTPMQNKKFGAESFGGTVFTYGAVDANTWTRMSFYGNGARNGGGYAYFGILRSTYASDEMYVLLKSPIYIDLTLMFGEGNEPTKDEFEALCEFNNVDLTQSYPRNIAGTTQLWKIP